MCLIKFFWPLYDPDLCIALPHTISPKSSDRCCPLWQLQVSVSGWSLCTWAPAQHKPLCHVAIPGHRTKKGLLVWHLLMLTTSSAVWSQPVSFLLQVIAGSGLDVGFALISPRGYQLVSDLRRSDGIHMCVDDLKCCPANTCCWCDAWSLWYSRKPISYKQALQQRSGVCSERSKTKFLAADYRMNLLFSMLLFWMVLSRILLRASFQTFLFFSHRVDLTEDGDYRLCFDNSFSKLSQKMVFFEVIINSQSSAGGGPDEWVDVAAESLVEYKLEDIRVRISCHWLWVQQAFTTCFLCKNFGSLLPLDAWSDLDG